MIISNFDVTHCQEYACHTELCCVSRCATELDGFLVLVYTATINKRIQHLYLIGSMTVPAPIIESCEIDSFHE